ncbi:MULTISPECIES: YczE/YyaS/YitT family protein [Aneurinibacillus]|uniref:Uncharacterized membrane protein YczE n=1 Tax=Aneurinibacillus thermoaerophilus TaxID=143495 RepID=A0A1G7YA79_ANETH|nr:MULTISPECIES: YitT family protein [Aneurinibacillus]AMA72150.1 hypothetical protein ACH33_04305 [Aneurinibacillus sp. XH2]MED0676435.1 YitT family protein [Aneurinibacillus thermoaerophilus]MED0678947.1 YitT family protein [Aneurinibacillus thermoaerophilus]MED0736484.1 YitT family protein [Aneurinibacillus thermoaerophilus]MED0755987.1 YitT family protein [Aneurinibacillus thermoaerophilus]
MNQHQKAGRYLTRFILFIAGLFILSLGVVIMMQAGLGVNSWDVLHIGLTQMTSLSMGTWVQIVGIIVIALTCYLERKFPSVGTVLNIVLIGFFINWILSLHIITSLHNFWLNLIMLIFGIVLMGFGAGMYVASGLGAGPRDGLTLVLSDRLGWSISRVRTMLEGIALFLGWLVHGPIFIGTLLSVFLIGPVMQVSLLFWRKQLVPSVAKPTKLQKVASIKAAARRS